MRKWRPLIGPASRTRSGTSRTTMRLYSCRRASNRPASGSKFTQAETQLTVFDRLSSGKPRGSRRKLRLRAQACPKPRVEQMFKRNKDLKIDTLIGAGTRINGDV